MKIASYFVALTMVTLGGRASTPGGRAFTPDDRPFTPFVLQLSMIKCQIVNKDGGICVVNACLQYGGGRGCRFNSVTKECDEFRPMGIGKCTFCGCSLRGVGEPAKPSEKCPECHQAKCDSIA